MLVLFFGHFFFKYYLLFAFVVSHGVYVFIHELLVLLSVSKLL